MSAEVSIAFAVSGRVLANILCTNKPQLGAGVVGLANGFLIHHAWLAGTLLDPFTLLIFLAGIAFDHSVYSIYGVYGQGGIEGVLTEIIACGLGVILADVGPNVWYELAGERFGKQFNRELDALGLGGLVPYNDDYDSASDVDLSMDEQSDAGSASVVSGASSRRTSRSARSSVTVRPTRTRSSPTPFRMAGVTRSTIGPRTTSASTITRLSRVTFDESSITQSQSSDADVEELLSAGPSEGNGNDLYMEPSTMGSTRSGAQTMPGPSILRRLHIPRQEATTNSNAGPSAPAGSSATTLSTTRLMSDGETTPRATTRPDFSEFTPLSPPSGYAAPAAPSNGAGERMTFPEPELSPTDMNEYSPRIIPPSESSPGTSVSIALPEPVHFPEPSPLTPASVSTSASTVMGNSESLEDEEDHGHGHSGLSRLSQIMNVPIAPPSRPSSRTEERSIRQTQTPPPLPNPFENENVNGHMEHLESVPESPDSARLWAADVAPQSNSSTRSRERSRERSRSRSPAGPRPQPPPSYRDSPPPPSQSVANTFGQGQESYMSETYNDSIIDVRQLTREEAILRIEEAWKNVGKKHHKRLNVLVRHDDDELQTSTGKNSTFHLMEDLENLRFNFKIRPGIIMIISRPRGL